MPQQYRCFASCVLFQTMLACHSFPSRCLCHTRLHTASLLDMRRMNIICVKCVTGKSFLSCKLSFTPTHMLTPLQLFSHYFFVVLSMLSSSSHDHRPCARVLVTIAVQLQPFFALALAVLLLPSLPQRLTMFFALQVSTHEPITRHATLHPHRPTVLSLQLISSIVARACPPAL